MKGIAEVLLAYYDEHKRDLPWRGGVPAYYTWISEIMLQQTRVEAVKPYFARFIESLPDIESLATCEEESLMKLWQGLGYYSRARNLQKAAKQIMEEHEGILPEEKKELLNLAGIGPYTAGAISSIAYGKKETAVDGNVIRVMSRLYAVEGDVMAGAGRKKIEALTEAELPEERAGDFNQALMDLGASVCIPNGAALCPKCPLDHFCDAYQKREVEKYPEKKKKKARRLERKTVLLVKQGEKLALEQREKKGLLAGLWQFPLMDGRASKKEVREFLEKKGFQLENLEEGEPAIHIFSHVEWHMVSYRLQVKDGEAEGWIFVDKDAIEKVYSIPSAFKKYLEEL